MAWPKESERHSIAAKTPRIVAGGKIWKKVYWTDKQGKQHGWMFQNQYKDGRLVATGKRLGVR